MHYSLRIPGQAARRFFRQARGGPARCPRCGAERLYGLKDGRLRCPCGYTFAEFAGTWLSRVKLSAEAWFALLRHFAAGTPVEDAADKLQLAYGTVFKAYRVVRLAMVAGSADGPALLDPDGEPAVFCREGLDRGVGCAACRSPVFAVREGRVELFGRARARDVFGLSTGLPLRLARTLVYTGPFRGAAGLVFSCCRTARETYRHRFEDGRTPLPLDGADGFMTFAGQWLERYHCLSPQTFPLYLKEFELRYALRGRPLLPALARLLARPTGPVPKAGD